jgi:hypothetical protein
MAIRVTYTTIDGFRQSRRYEADAPSLARARAFAQRCVGQCPDIGSHDAVSADGVGKIAVRGVSLGLSSRKPQHSRVATRSSHHHHAAPPTISPITVRRKAMPLASVHFTRPPADRLDAIIAVRLARLADLEAAIEQAAEQSAMRRLSPVLRTNRKLWPRSAWRAFVRAAARQAAALQPELQRLRRPHHPNAPRHLQAASLMRRRQSAASLRGAFRATPYLEPVSYATSAHAPTRRAATGPYSTRMVAGPISEVMNPPRPIAKQGMRRNTDGR